MTGFGRGEAIARGVRAQVELRSGNRRQRDVTLTLPKPLMACEAHLERLIRKKISRGAVHGTVIVERVRKAQSGGFLVDRSLATAYVAALRATAARLGLRDDLTASVLVRLPDVVRSPDVIPDAALAWRAILRAAGHALRRLIHTRKREGRALEVDVRRRVKRVQNLLRRIQRRSPQVTRRQQAALRARLCAAGARLQAKDRSALLREAALIADRGDISEELVRVASHVAQAGRLLERGRRVGRPLDFLCQEIFRELNTMGAKANDVLIARWVMAAKAETEAIREQIQNVE